jgi:hypothetical protein
MNEDRRKRVWVFFLMKKEDVFLPSFAEDHTIHVEPSNFEKRAFKNASSPPESGADALRSPASELLLAPVIPNPKTKDFMKPGPKPFAANKNRDRWLP